MSIEVKVLSSASKRKIVKKEQPKVLTNKYIRELNKGISHRIIERESEQIVAKRTLTNKYFR